VADARRCPKLTAFLEGVEQPALSVQAQGGSLQSVPELPAAIDPGSTATYIVDVMTGARPLPLPIATQVMALRALADAGRD
jgi:anthranilate phosphoribosyltransferase